MDENQTTETRESYKRYIFKGNIWLDGKIIHVGHRFVTMAVSLEGAKNAMMLDYSRKTGLNLECLPIFKGEWREDV